MRVTADKYFYYTYNTWYELITKYQVALVLLH